ncbi:MAG: dUTP diphosphatase [Ruminococcus sp.]|nr:dUTP diphosphatase [Ruminococcus sp.]
MKLLIKKLRDNAVVPKRATEGSAGCDLSACLDAPLVIKPGKTVKVPTGIACELTGAENFVLLIYARSSTATKKGLAPANCVGVVDSDYRGELLVALHNHSGEERVIEPGERIAQLVAAPVFLPEIVEAQELTDTERGSGGFGSTGTKV